MTRPSQPLKLLHCSYPKSTDFQHHGFFKLQDKLPKVDFESALKFRSYTFTPKPLNGFDKSMILELSHLIAASFALNEPMLKHINPPVEIPREIVKVKHKDEFGMDQYGPWTKENIMFWFMRLFLLTNPSQPRGAIKKNDDLIKHSLVIIDDKSKAMGGALNITLPSKEEAWRVNDPFIEATLNFKKPILDFIHNHEHIVIQALKDKIPDFKVALQSGKVGYVAMIARSPELPSEHTFEIFASSFEGFQQNGYKYILIAATNQWTGAACETMGAARIYFAPFRDKKRVAMEIAAGKDETFSIDGYLSGKDSGMMIYAVKI